MLMRKLEPSMKKTTRLLAIATAWRTDVGNYNSKVNRIIKTKTIARSSKNKLPKLSKESFNLRHRQQI